MAKRGEKQKEEGRKRKEGGGGDCTSYLREECTRGHILHSTALACPMFNSLALLLCKTAILLNTPLVQHITYKHLIH